MYFLGRCLRDGRYVARLGERFGQLPQSWKQTGHGSIWLHAVSVGEVLSSVGLLERLRAQYPRRRLFLSTTTVAGRALAGERLGGLADGVFYAPVDSCFAVRGVLRTLRPLVVVALETEIWPNLWREVVRSGCRLVVVNGRISDRAIGRYRRLRWFFREVLALPHAILAQGEQAAGRYRELGAPAERVRAAGNLKYDFDTGRVQPPAAVRELIGRLGPEAVWIAASTMPPAHGADVDEDDLVLDAFQALRESHPGLLLVLVPRRPERFETAAGKLEQRGVPYLRRSMLEAGAAVALPGVLLVDSMGELGGLFALADVVFMGGTLADRGGHNILEPAFFGKPIVAGPHLENFAEIAAEFRAARALVEIENGAALAPAVARLLKDAVARDQFGSRARELARARSGGTRAAIEEIGRQLDLAVPRDVPTLAWRCIGWPLAKIWELGARWGRARGLRRRRALSTPVISIGGLTWGGTGKTPFVLWLATHLREQGLSAAILTRGYRRRVPARQTILEAGAKADVAVTGDEAAILLRSGVAAVAIGADRWATGRLVEKRFRPDVMLLDDGFQHHRLERCLDIVLLDALDPFGGGALVPLGRMREPIHALARAGLVIITRAEPGRAYEGIRAEIRRYNRHAPVLAARVDPRRWVSASTTESWEPAKLPFVRVAAFCGLGNPGSFWNTVEALGYRLVSRWNFPDHHHYRPAEIHRLAAQAKAAGAQALLTTEKDLMNLPQRTAALVEPLALCWLEIALEVVESEELLALIRRTLSLPAAAAAARPPGPATSA